MTKTVTCPTCGNKVPWTPASRWRPFCSERCRLIDLGEWLDEGHRLSEPSDGLAWQEPEDGRTDIKPH
jgi:endogenous inhibitor of DNA gyrase (YacG/DUF329 family)